VRRALAAVLAAAALAAACSGSGSEGDPLASSTTASTEPPTTTTTLLPLPVPEPIAWRGCGGGFQCGTLTVPVDYADPAGPTLQVAAVRRPAGDPERRIGTLVVNPGGPGASGVRRVRRGFEIAPEIAERFDIVGFDPRGIGDSTPITCGGAVRGFRDQDLAPTTPAGQQALEAAAKAVADECAATEGVRLAHLGTLDVARDLEELRMAMGEPQISFVGLSYGTLLGLLWAEMYPASVRAMVLDGVVRPEEDGTETSPEQLRGIDRAFQAMADACAQDPACPATADGGLVAAYDRLAAQLAGQPGTTRTGITQLRYAVFMATYGSEHWPALWRALHDGLRGDRSGIAALAAQYEGLVAYTPFLLVTCLDTPHATTPGAWARDASRAAEASPRFGAALANELLPCAFLPESPYRPHPIRAPGTPPILVVGSTGDVATPYDQAVAVAQELAHGVLLTVELQGHIAIDASDCADEAIARYLVDGAVPAPGTRC
jgi:pimeloyl-ACP methyl ester carboxylesterase